jgi:hypothetical protein
MTASAIEDADQDTPWMEERLVNMWPAFFNFSDEDEDRTIPISIDRNMKHARQNKHTLCGFESFQTQLFLDYGRKKFDLANSANNEVNTIIPSNASGHKIKPTERWNRPKTITATTKV